LTVWAFLLALSFYPDYFGWLAWVALVRPLIILSRLKGREAFTASYFFAFCFNAFSLYWVSLVTPPGAVAAVAIVSLYYAAVLVLFNRVYQRKPLYGMIAAPFLWVGMEYFRTLSEFAFPWSDLGYSQSFYLYVVQIVSIISVHGLSFLIVAVNVLLWQVLRKELAPAPRLTCFWSAAGVVGLLVAYGWAVVPVYPREGKLDVAVMQGSIPVEVKWQEENEAYSFHLYDSLAQTAAGQKIKLYVWPETAAPSYLTHDAAGRAALGATVSRTGAWHLIGSLGAEEKGGRLRYFNSAYLFSPDGQMGPRYDKVNLVPFTEQVPYQDYLPFLRKEFLTKYLSFIETYDVAFWSDFYPGDSIKLFEFDQYRFGTLICYEAVFPEYTRRMILEGADFLVNITNDSWWGHSVGLHMHSRFPIIRAIENRCWVVRAANSGWSFIVDDYGRIRGRLPLDAVAVLPGRINGLDGFSVFTRVGDLAGKSCFLLTVLLAAIFVTQWLSAKIVRRPRSR